VNGKRSVAIITPVKGLFGKSRLSPVLTEDERRCLVKAFIQNIYEIMKNISLPNFIIDYYVASRDEDLLFYLKRNNIPYMETRGYNYVEELQYIQTVVNELNYIYLVLIAYDLPLIDENYMKMILIELYQLPAPSAVIVPSRYLGSATIGLSPPLAFNVELDGAHEPNFIIQSTNIKKNNVKFRVIFDFRGYVDIDYPRDLVELFVLKDYVDVRSEVLRDCISKLERSLKERYGERALYSYR